MAGRGRPTDDLKRAERIFGEREGEKREMSADVRRDIKQCRKVTDDRERERCWRVFDGISRYVGGYDGDR